MKKLIAIFGLLAMTAACGGADEEAAVVEDTVPAITETAPVTPAPMDTTMAPVDTTVADTTADTTAAH